MAPNPATPQPRNTPHEPRIAGLGTPQTNPAIPPTLRVASGGIAGRSFADVGIPKAFAGFEARS